MAYQMNWREKLAALEAIEYTNHSVSSVLGVWERRPQGADGNGLVPVTKKYIIFFSFTLILFPEVQDKLKYTVSSS